MPVVYFIYAEGEQEYFKIGCASNLDKRLLQLQCGNRRKLVVYKTIESIDKHALEKAIHRYFKDKHERGEWFNITFENIDHIVSNMDLLGGVIENKDSAKKRKQRTKYIWESNYKLLLKYIEENKKLPPAGNNHEYEGIRLSAWCATQCTQYNKKLLEKDRIEKLEKISIWKWNKSKDNVVPWEQRVEIITNFVNLFDRLPKVSESFEGIDIGRIVSRARVNYNKGELRNELIVLFETIPKWSWKHNGWEQNYIELSKFIIKHNRYPTEEDDISLHRWTQIQRRESYFDDYKRQKLEELSNWTWDNSRNMAVGLKKKFGKLQILQEFIEENNRFPKVSEKYNGINIGQWVCSTRCRIKNDNIDEKTKNIILREFPQFMVSSGWDGKFELLKEWIESNNKLPKQKEEYEGFKIGIWVANQRRDKDKLSVDRINKLNELPYWRW